MKNEISNRYTFQDIQKIQNTRKRPLSLPTIAAKVSDIYFAPKPWETKGLYKSLGVKAIKKFTPSEILRRFTPDNKLAYSWFTLEAPTVESAKKYDRYTRIWESIHAFGTLLGANYFLIHEGLDLSTAENCAMLIVNLSAVLVQRYNRTRIYQILERSMLDTDSSNLLQG